MLLNLGCGKLQGFGELMLTLNVQEGEVRSDTKRMGNARFPTFLQRMLLRRHI